MKRLETVLGLVLLAGSTGFVMSTCLAATDEAPPAAVYYALVGNWHGSGELAEPGQPPAKLALDLACRKAASGWAVACDLNAQNESMTMTETGPDGRGLGDRPGTLVCGHQQRRYP